MKRTRRILAAVVAIIMIFAAIPMTVFAANYTIGLGQTISVSIPENGYAYCEFTPAKDGKYVVYSERGVNQTDPIVSVKDADGNEVAYGDDSVYLKTNDFYCIFDAEGGEKYSFELGEYDGKKVNYDITMVAFGEIVHQPNPEEPYVSITEGSYALYNWCKINEAVEITDKEASPCEGEDGTYSTYDPEKGWAGVYNGSEFDGYKEYNLFSVNLEPEQTIKIKADKYALLSWIRCDCGVISVAKPRVYKDEPAAYTANHTCRYTISGNYESAPHANAEFIDAVYLQNETGSVLETTEAGRYFCEVIFDGCRPKNSVEFDLDGSTSGLGSKRIKNADIKFRTDIAGMNVNEYGDMIKILSSNLELEDNYGDAAVYVYDETGKEYTGAFVNGKTYKIQVYLSPVAGYKLSSSIVGTVNDMVVSAYVDSWTPGGQYGNTVVDYVRLDFEITVTEPCSHMCHQGGISGFFWSIINFFNKLFGLNPFCSCGAAHY